MSKEVTVIAVGVWVVIVPYLGIPTPWKTMLLIATGLFLIGFGFFWRARGFTRGVKHGAHHPFVENASPEQ